MNTTLLYRQKNRIPITTLLTKNQITFIKSTEISSHGYNYETEQRISS